MAWSTAVVFIVALDAVAGLAPAVAAVMAGEESVEVGAVGSMTMSSLSLYVVPSAARNLTYTTLVTIWPLGLPRVQPLWATYGSQAAPAKPPSLEISI